MRVSRSAAVLTTALLAAIAVLATGCGQERSAKAYCNAFWDRALPLHDQYQSASSTSPDNPIPALINLFSSPRDLAGMLDAMAKVAPEEIRPDTEQVRDAFNRLADSYGESLTNPLGGLAAGVGNALSVSGPMAHVDAYVTAHCGTPEQARAARE